MAPPREARHGPSTVDNHMPESPRHRQSPDDSRAFSVGLPWRQALLSPIARSSRTSFLVAILVSFLFAAMPSTNAIREPVVPSRTVVDVPPGGDLQQALDQAQPGDTIQLAAGAAYTGPFTLPTKSGSAFIVVRTSTPDSALPPPGTRIRTSDVPRLARVDASGGSVFATAPGAHHYRFVGLEIAPTPGTFLYNVVLLGDGTESTVDQQPHDIVIEHCYIHGDAFAGSRRGIAMNGVNLAVYDSILADFKEVGADSQALAGWSGAGPFTIVNNELDGAGENLMFGGADPSVSGLSVLGYDNNFPSQQTNNVTIENNLLYDLNASTWGGFGAFVLMLNGTADVAIEHNTVFQSQHVLLADLLPNTGFVFANNIAPHNLYGVFGSGRA